MIVDIAEWELIPYHAWGFFCIPSHTVQVEVKSIFSYCVNLDAQSISIVFISLKHVAGVNHAYLASYFAAKAMTGKKNLAKDLGMELLLYLSCQNQIYAAITNTGISDIQKSTKEMWAVVFFSSSIERLLKEKLKLEAYLGASVLDPDQDSQRSCLNEKSIEIYNTNPAHFAVLEKMVQPIPRLPVTPVSNQEIAVLQSLIEKMVILSIEEIKSES